MFKNRIERGKTLPKKIYVLDSSVLLSAGKKALFAFEEHNVIIPVSVIQMLEEKKNDSQLGYTARSALREIEKLRERGNGHLNDGILLTEEGGSLRVELNHSSLDKLRSHNKSIKIDNDERSMRVIAVSLSIKEEQQKDGDIEVVLVSNNLPQRIKAEAVGLKAEEFYGNSVRSQGYYSGFEDQIHVPSNVIDSIFKSASAVEVDKKYFSGTKNPARNFGVQFVHGKQKVLGLVQFSNGKYYVTKCSYKKNLGESRFTPGSPEQYIGADYVDSSNSVKIVSIGGDAGTGKTALTLAVGFEDVINNIYAKSADQVGYSKLLVFRPMNPVGNQEYGFLPGSEEEKMDPWAAAVYDALSASASTNIVEEVKRNKCLEVLPVTHVRGRTFDNSLIIIDEAQNLESIVLLSVLSRAGKNSKVVFLWDANQRDNLNISKDDGIINIVEYFKDTPEFAHIEFTKSERSDVAELANTAIKELIGL